MRSRLIVLVAVLFSAVGCSKEASFDRRYSDAQNEIDARSAELGSALNDQDSARPATGECRRQGCEAEGGAPAPTADK